MHACMHPQMGLQKTVLRMHASTNGTAKNCTEDSHPLTLTVIVLMDAVLKEISPSTGYS